MDEDQWNDHAQRYAELYKNGTLGVEEYHRAMDMLHKEKMARQQYEFEKQYHVSWKDDTEKNMADLRWNASERTFSDKSNEWKGYVEVELEKMEKFRQEYHNGYKELNELVHGLETRMVALESWFSRLEQQTKKSEAMERVEAFSLLDDL